MTDITFDCPNCGGIREALHIRILADGRLKIVCQSCHDDVWIEK